MTEWLDGMSLVDTTRYQTNNGVFRVGFPQDMVSNDPALTALLQIGSNSVPVLVKRIVEPPEPEVKGFWIRLRLRLQQKWIQIRRSGYSAPPAVYPHRQQARKLAAAFTLMALGTNANGGFGRALEAYAAVPVQYRSVAWDLRGGIPLERAVIMAMNNLPERKAEIVADIVAGLNHTNAAWREGAVSSAGIYRDELPV